MRTLTRATIAVAAASLLGACADNRATAPTTALSLAAASAQANPDAGSLERTVRILDQCDPASFNAVFGPGTCVGDHHGVLFDHFIAELAKHQVVPEWRNSPGQLELRLGDSFVARNDGGEVHTFTEVEEFGGGVIPELNELSGTPIPAPECLAVPPAGFLPPGGSQSDTPDAAGTEKYQCCIHPWMRATVRIRSK